MAHSNPKGGGDKNLPKKLTRKDRSEQAKARLELLPSVTDSEWRLACADVAQSLAENLLFKVRVAWPIVLLLLTIVGVFGFSTKKDIDQKLDSLKSTVDDRIGKSKEEITKQIDENFRTDKIQKIIANTASAKSNELISSSIEPAISTFRQTVDTQLKEFDHFTESQQQAVKADVLSLKSELIRLQRRNEISLLGDKATAKGDIKAFRKLAEMAEDSAKDEESSNAATAELVRVYAAYSFAGPTRVHSTKLNASGFNPFKTKESELSLDDLLPFLISEPGDIMRARIAFLISQRIHVVSYEIAEQIVLAIKKERNLEVMRYLRSAFSAATGFHDEGKLDGATELQWWDAHSEELRTKGAVSSKE